MDHVLDDDIEQLIVHVSADSDRSSYSYEFDEEDRFD